MNVGEEPAAEEVPRAFGNDSNRTVVSIVPCDEGPLLTFHSTTTTEPSDEGGSKCIKYEIPSKAVQRSQVLTALAESSEDEPSTATFPFPPSAMVTWQNLYSKTEGSIKLPDVVQGLEVASYLGDDATAAFTATLLTQHLRTSLVRKIPSTVQAPPFPVLWQSIPNTVQALVGLPDDALVLVMARFDITEVLSAPDAAIKAWVASCMHENSGVLQLRQVHVMNHESGDAFLQLLSKFWNAPATAECCALCLPALSDTCCNSHHRRPIGHVAQRVRLVYDGGYYNNTKPQHRHGRVEKSPLSAPITQPLSSVLQPLTRMTSLTMGSNTQDRISCEARLLCEVLELLPNLQSLTLHLDSMPGSPTDEEIGQFVSLVSGLGLQSLSFSFPKKRAHMYSEMCPCLRRSRYLTKLVLPDEQETQEFAPVIAVLPLLTALRWLGCVWPSQKGQSSCEALRECLARLKPLTALSHLDLQVRHHDSSADSSSELQILSKGLEPFRNLKKLRFMAACKHERSADRLSSDTIAGFNSLLKKVEYLELRLPPDEYSIQVHVWPEFPRGSTKGWVDERLLLALLPALKCCSVFTDFHASLVQYGVAGGRAFRPLRSALSMLTALTYLEITGELSEIDNPDAVVDSDDEQEMLQDYAGYDAFLSVLSESISSLSLLRSVCIEWPEHDEMCESGPSTYKGKASSFLAQLIGKTTLQCLILTVSGRALLDDMWEAVDNSCLGYSQLTKLRLDGRYSAQSISAGAASVLEHLKMLKDLSMQTLYFSAQQCTLLRHFPHIEKLALQISNRRVSRQLDNSLEDWGVVGDALCQLTCLKHLEIDCSCGGGDKAAQELGKRLTSLVQLTSLRCDIWQCYVFCGDHPGRVEMRKQLSGLPCTRVQDLKQGLVDVREEQDARAKHLLRKHMPSSYQERSSNMWGMPPWAGMMP